jgi:hypothetical protein
MDGGGQSCLKLDAPNGPQPWGQAPLRLAAVLLSPTGPQAATEAHRSPPEPNLRKRPYG